MQQLTVQATYNYIGCKVIEASIDTSSLIRIPQGIDWASGVNKGKLCRYKATLDTPLDNRITVEGQLQILDIIETNQKNPSIVLQDVDTNIVAGEKKEIQTSSFLNNQPTVMSKVLGCSIYIAKDRENHAHCSMPMINHEQSEYPSLYLIISPSSTYVGITYRLLQDRMYEHCTYKWKDDTVKRGKSTYDIMAYEDAKVYCIGRFTDYTLDEIKAMSDDERKEFHHQMELIETLFITLASKQFPHLELVNRKQILKDEKAIVKHLGSLPFVNVEIHWEALYELGFDIPRTARGKGRSKVTLDDVEFIYYDDNDSIKYYVPKQLYYDRYTNMVKRHRDTEHLNKDYYFDYAMMTYLLLPHKTQKQLDYMLDLLNKQLAKTDNRHTVTLYRPIGELIEECKSELDNLHCEDEYYEENRREIQMFLDLYLDIQAHPTKYRVMKYYCEDDIG